MTINKSRQKLILLLLTLASVLIGLVVMGWFYWPQHPELPTSSIDQFAYDSGNSAAVKSQVHSGRKLDFAEVHLTGLPPNTLRYMPLFWRPPTTSQRWLIFATQDLRLMAYDLEENKVVWETHLPNIASSTPFIDVEKNLLYVGTREWLEPPQQIPGWYHHLNEINISGKLLKSCPVNLDRFFSPRGLSEAQWRPRIHCKTAMGGRPTHKASQVFWGCSISTSFEPLYQYGDTKGVTGLVLGFPLDSEGHLTDCDSWSAFPTSRTGENPWLGFDTGVYLLGSKPALLSDGSILVATGNGPVDWANENFGCSVVRVKPDLTAHRRSDNTISGFSAADSPYDECWTMNNEYANSSVAVTSTAKGLLAGVSEKYGRMTFFEPDHLEPSKKRVTEIDRGAGWSYGQPAVIPHDRGARFFFLQSADPYKRPTDTFLATEEILTQLTGQGRQLESSCFGYALEKATPSAKELTLYYSGPLREDRAVALKDSSGSKELTSVVSRFGESGKDRMRKGLWGPYVEVSSLGYLSQTRSELASLRPSHFPIELETGVWDEDVAHLQWSTEPPRPLGSPFYYLRPRKPLAVCPTLSGSGLKSLYEIHLPPLPSLDRDMVFAYDYDSQSARLAWELSLGPDEHLSRAHPAVSTDAEGHHPVLVVSIEKPLAVPLKSVVLFIDGEDGEVLSRFEYNGKMHFSMPLIFDEMVVIPTVDDGLKVFRLKD